MVTLGLKGQSRFAGRQGGELIFNEGYNHASNFSAAFVKHFGISPKAISKKGR